MLTAPGCPVDERPRDGGVHRGRTVAVYPCGCVIEANAVRWRRDAGVPAGMTLGGFRADRRDASPEQRRSLKEALITAQAFAAGEAQYHVLVIVGGFGAGKTHLLAGIVEAWLARRLPARYRFVPDLLGELRAAMDQQGASPDAIVQGYAFFGLLGLDDLGAGRSDPTGWAVEQLERIVDWRYQRGPPLVVTSNYGPADLAARWGGRLADRLWDVQTSRVKVVHLDVPSYRTGR